MTQVSRQEYVGIFGPTVGDKIRLGNTDLYLEIEKDLRVYGEELIYGGGKTMRDGMGMDNHLTRAGGALDLVITNVTVVDATLGVIKADVGIRDGLIVGIGKAGNPNTMHGVSTGMAVGPATDAISGEHLILTAGGIDTHVHYISPQQVWHALANGVTTFWGGGVGPTDGSLGTTCTSGPWNIHMMLKAVEELPVNIGILCKAAAGRPPLIEQVEAGVAGFKAHEDWGTPPSVLRQTLAVCDEYDVQMSIHTDTLNEGGYVEDTIAAFEGRTIHTFHSEGAGGGHAPDIIKVAGEVNVLPSSTNPTLPYGINSQAELFDMIMVCHNLSPKIPSDVAFAGSRVRAETIAAENVLQDIGAISMFSSDSQAMGRVGENWLRAVQTADAMKKKRGKLPEDAEGNDNFRVLRYVAKITINPAIAQGCAHMIGSIAPGKLADLVLWEPGFFGAKPKLIIKGGLVNYAEMGDPNASLAPPQPLIYRPMFGAMGRAMRETCVTFVSGVAHELGIAEKLRLERRIEPVKNCRAPSKKDMVRNDKTPKIEVNPETFEVLVDGQHATVEPSTEISMNQLYFFG